MEIEAQLDKYFSDKHEENASAIKIDEDAILELASLIEKNKNGGQE